MSKAKTQAKPNKAIDKANANALKGFPKAKLRKAFETIAGSANEADASNEAKQSAALAIVAMAEDYRSANSDATLDAVVTGWRDEMRVLTMQLAIDGNRFAKLTEGKDDKPATAKLTGYGNNVASIAKGAIEFDCGPVALAASGEIDGDVSYRDCRKAVEGARADARRAADPDAATFADTMAEADEAWKELRDLIANTGDIKAAKSLLGTMRGHVADVTAQLIEEQDVTAELIEEQDEVDAEAA